jgi:hypothetical protein
VAGFADRIDGEYRVDIVQTNCPIALPRITIDAEGMFVDVALDERIRAAEAVFVDGALWIKMTIVHEGVARELSGTLRTSPEGGFAGTLYEDTQSVCGNWPAHKVVLTSFR